MPSFGLEQPTQQAHHRHIRHAKHKPSRQRPHPVPESRVGTLGIGEVDPVAAGAGEAEFCRKGGAEPDEDLDQDELLVLGCRP